MSSGNQLNVSAGERDQTLPPPVRSDVRRARAASEMSPIKDFSLVYEAVNKYDTFSQGDAVAGMVTLTLTKDTKVKSFKVKVKGAAHVHWTEGSGDNRRSYSSHRKYFKVKEYLIEENAGGTVLSQGEHRYNFTLKIPQGDIPSSYKGLHGKIIYMLEAKISRSWQMPSVVQKELNFVTKSFPHIGQSPQSGSVGKEMGIFSKGEVNMSATVDRKVCSPGDTLSVVAKICNSSSKKMRPKFSIHKKIVYRASGSTTTSNESMCKMVGETITPKSEETVSCQLKIPDDVIPTLCNCDIISVDYCLKVYLDISFAIDPEVVFPLVIIHPSFAAPQLNEAVGPYPAGAPSYSDFPPPAFPMGPYPVPAGPGAYGYPAPDPTQHANATGGYNNPWPQQVTPYSSANAAFPPSSVQHQAPTAPPVFQQGENLPTYTSLFPPSHDTFGGSYK